MSTPGVPPWGCPWHGLVRNQQLTLPNGEVIPFPMLGAQWYQRGHTRLVRHPNAPQDQRTEAQREIDDAAGRQWWREAIISGGSLHGRPLRFGRTWLYVDPAGHTWLAECDVSLFSETIIVTLSRFGVLGGTPQRFSYSIARPDLGQDAPELAFLSLDIALVDSKIDGSGALFGIYGNFRPAPGTVFPLAPVGWFEVQLAGLGSECEVTAATLKTRAQALGEVTIEDRFTEGETYQHGPLFDPVYGYEPNPQRSIVLYRNVSFEGAYDLKRRSVTGKVLAMMYAPDGGVRELTLDLSSQQTGSVLASGVNFGADAYDGAFTTTSEVVTSVRLRLDGDSLFDETYNATLDASQMIAGDYRAGAAVSWTRVSNLLWTFPDGSESTEGSGTTEWDFGFQPTVGWPVAIVDFESALGNSAARIGPDPFFIRYTAGGQLQLQPAMHSLNLYSMTTRLPSESGTRYIGRAATNSGVIDVEPLLTSAAPIYGSWCPVTGQAARDTVPICYT